jgi:hypothetical protein
MKKVRYAAGAIGVIGAVPAIGLMTTPATAATHAPARTGKTVALTSQVPRIPDVACDARSAVASATDIKATIFYSRDTGCVHSVIGYLFNHTNTGWWMRIRSYVGGILTYSKFDSRGLIQASHDRIRFQSLRSHMHVSKVCEAMVRSTSDTQVKYGPICEATGY